ncbi:hypothetical protein HK107_03530 [Parvularcula sp. ZS-1/3]|uniref:Uncharacterized protein n=1 Tax=Parvularcula mediterranea TaxID=2732508 RepID=A0A7Y3W4F1_9PROT|nr:hypothetical protein [Parvularcula mediterranea]NNU15398.1 hypothetical protein [Parvularcula mediterranea]
MDSQLIIILVAVAIVIAGTFVLKRILGTAVKLAGLGVVAFLARRQDIGAQGYDWVQGLDVTVIAAAALFGWVVGIILNLFVFREDGFGRHFFVPLIAVAMSYAAALLIEL